MKRPYRRITAALLAALMLICCFIPAGAAAVTLPAGYSEQQIEACIPKTERLLSTMLAAGGSAGLSASVYGTLFSDETLNALFSGIYKGFSENQSTLEALEIDVSVPAVAAAVQGYPGVCSVLQGKTAWSQALPAVVNMKWGVGDKTQFASALSAMLSPLNPLLYTLLCAGTYNARILINITGDNGYQNAIVPLLQTLGCPQIMSQADFTAAAAADNGTMVKNLCGMLFAVMDNILNAPVSSLCTYLPPIARYLNNGGISNTLKALMEPMQVKIAIFSLPGVSQLLENTELFSSSSDLTTLLGNADLGGMMGGTVPSNLSLPEIDLAALEGCGSEQNGVFVSNRAQTFVLLLHFLIDTVKRNQGLLTSAGVDASSAGTLLKKDSETLTGLILKLLTMEGKPVTLNAGLSYPAYSAGTAAFTEHLTRENFERVLEQIDPTLNEFLEEFTDLGSLSELAKKAIYSNRLVTELLKTLYGALDTNEAAGLSSLMNLPVTPAGVAASIRGSFPSAARAIGAVSRWENLNADLVRWGFSDGSKSGFTKTLTALLRPFAPYLRFLLAEGTLTVMNTVSVGGGNGYENTIQPLLESLGCDPADIPSYASYKKGGDTALITGILDPVTALLDRVCAAPVAEICGLLPNLVYFAQSSVLQQCMTNLMNPITALIKEVGLEGLLPEDLTASMQTNVDLADLTSRFTAGNDLGFPLPEPDLALVKSLGAAVNKTGKNGQQLTFIEADRPLVLLTLLRYLLGAVKNSGDPDVLTKLMGDSPAGMGSGSAAGDAAGMDMMAMYADKIGAQLAGMSVDETIEWLYDLLFAETPKREETDAEEIIPTIIYQKQKDYTTLIRVTVVVLVLGLMTSAVIFFAKFDFSAAKEKRERKKKKKTEWKQATAKMKKNVRRRA